MNTHGLPLFNVALILAGKALASLFHAYDSFRELADCRDAFDVVCMALCYALVYVPLALMALVLAGRFA